MSNEIIPVTTVTTVTTLPAQPGYRIVIADEETGKVRLLDPVIGWRVTTTVVSRDEVNSRVDPLTPRGDALVNSSGIAYPDGTICDFDGTTWRSMTEMERAYIRLRTSQRT